MKKNQLGNSDLNLSEIGLGTWAIGGGDWGMGWGAQDEHDSIASILEGLSRGSIGLIQHTLMGLESQKLRSVKH